MQKMLILFFTGIISLLFISCGDADKPARGAEDEVFVVADSAEYEQLKPALEAAFEKLIYTPQPEKLFTLQRISPNEIEKYQESKNLVITAPLNSGSNTSKFITAILDSASSRNISAGNRFVVKKYNIWAKNQLVVLLTAQSMEELNQRINENKDNLLYAFQEVSDKRLHECLYNSKDENLDAESKLLQKFGWIIYVQSNLTMQKEDPEGNFVWFKKAPDEEMQKYIFVHWMDNASPAYLNADSIKNMRNTITRKYYSTGKPGEKITISEDYFTSGETNFKGRYAILTQGLWNNSLKGSGPFVNYTFFDEKTRRIYMLDGAIFAPKYYKRNLIQQADVLLQSFMTADEVGDDKKQELAAAAKN